MKLEQTGGGLLLQVKVVPNSSRNQVVGMLGEALKVKVAQPPEEGKANRAVEALLAEVLGISNAQVSVVGGQTRPQKTVALRGIAREEAAARIAAALKHR